MTVKRFTCIEIVLPTQLRDEVSELLWTLDTIGMEENESGAQHRIRAFFPEEQFSPEMKRSASQQLLELGVEEGSFSFEVTEYNADEWLQSYRESFRSFPVGETFFIHPSWEEPSKIHPVNILIEPGHGFGTGTHESTRLSMYGLEDVVPTVDSVLDFGTGSGILAIAAQKLNPRLRVYAFDVDSLAVEAANENIVRNRVEQIRLLAGESTAIRTRFDLVVANLTANILRSVASELFRLARKELIISGITVDQEELVESRFREISSSIRRLGRWEEQDWVALRYGVWQES